MSQITLNVVEKKSSTGRNLDRVDFMFGNGHNFMMTFDEYGDLRVEVIKVGEVRRYFNIKQTDIRKAIAKLIKESK